MHSRTFYEQPTMTHRRTLLVIGPAIAALACLYFFLSGERYVETENAYLKADKVMVAPEISAAVSEVLVNDNQPVNKGQILFRLDNAMFEAARDRAIARQSRARTDIEALKAGYKARQAELQLARTNVAFAEKEYLRQTDLAQKRFTSEVQTDDRKHVLDTARQQVAVIEQDILRLEASLNHLPDAPLEQYPQYQEASAELAQATIQLQHTEVVAPFDGVVTNTPKMGQHLNAGSPALALVANRSLWVEANFNETELTHVQAGQPAIVHIDMFPDRQWEARVASLSPASGAEFSVLPPQNASGNWVKVVQRIPVRIELLPTANNNDEPQPILRAGMSVSVEIDTGANRWQRLF